MEPVAKPRWGGFELFARRVGWVRHILSMGIRQVSGPRRVATVAWPPHDATELWFLRAIAWNQQTGFSLYVGYPQLTNFFFNIIICVPSVDHQLSASGHTCIHRSLLLFSFLWPKSWSDGVFLGGLFIGLTGDCESTHLGPAAQG